MPDFAAAAARIAARTFRACGDAAVFERAGTGEVIRDFTAVLDRGYATEGHLSQRRLSAKLPISVITHVARGDRLTIEGETFEVTNEAARDQLCIEVLLRTVKDTV